MYILIRPVSGVNPEHPEAREKDKTITMGDVNEPFRKNVEQKKESQ